MKAPPFAYVRARELPAVFALLDRHGDTARILAGGQSLMPMLNMRVTQPGVTIDITRLPGLAGIELKNGNIHIGALATHAAIGASPVIRQHLPLLADAAAHIAHPAIRNRGTFGGSLALADPAAEWPACCVALDAQLVLASSAGTRRIAARDFFQGLYTTALQSHEVLSEVVIPVPAAGTRHAFIELARRRGDYAIVGVAALARSQQGKLCQLRLAYLGAGETPVLAEKTSQAFDLIDTFEKALTQAQSTLASELAPAADLYHSAATKLHLARVITARALKQLVQLAQPAA
ncbi:MAG: xanthine dehydrogenase family protein subunit M [Betaproteobacteria bacterium]|nr:xanthine dehydrogenase family protein subunit M [Betaproteobacteria bacterium]